MISLFLSPEKKEYMYQEKELEAKGISLSEIRTPASENRGFLCMIRGFLIFFASFGTIGGLISAFELPFHLPLVCLGFFFISMYVAFLYYNRVTFYLGYLLVFFLFTVSIFSFYWYVNSGYQAFMNTVYEKYSDYFYLSSVRQATEYITDRKLTISVAMLFIGTFLSILLNITISNRMSLFRTFLVTFPFIQIALYIQETPPVFYMALLLSCYITVGCLSRSEHFRISSVKKQKQRYERIRKKNLQIHSYLSDGYAMLILTIYSVIFSCLFLFLCSGIFYSDFGGRYTQNKLKATTDEYVKIFVQNGIGGFFDRYSGTGGLNHGMLGGVSSVRPDYETDLEVTFVPYSGESIYLKGYTGIYYDQNLFSPYTPEELSLSFVSESASQDYFPLPATDRRARMQITLLDTTETLLPYDTYYHVANTYSTGIAPSPRISTTTDGEAILQAFTPQTDTLSDLTETAFEIHYIPYESLTYYEKNPDITEEMETAVYEDCLQIPDYLLPVLQDFCYDAGLLELKEAADAATTYEEAQQARLAIASALKRYFATEFYYTMAPGTAPRNSDSVEYFLTVQQRGYCAHFASSSALILRYLGIPTRYAEGYCMQLSDVLNASVVSTNTVGWFEGENYLADSGLVNVALSDGAAHAWVEIYIDGYGWIPYEMTPPSTEDTVNLFQFAGLFSGLLQNASSATILLSEGASETPDTEDTSPGFSFRYMDFLLKPLLIILACAFCLLLLAFLFQDFQRKWRISRLLKKERYAEALLLSYHHLVWYLQKKELLTRQNPTPRDTTAFLERYLEFEYNETKQTEKNNRSKPILLPNYLEMIHQAAYGPDGINKEQYQKASDITALLFQKVRNKEKENRKENKKKRKC